ncbi:MAG: hypothetical protein KME57_35555 [Scytonema hyalinum WJT4-NPBG1]|nr:hypothetical protein [Scytonema hyalinum WJT4-NPBG1]
MRGLATGDGWLPTTEGWLPIAEGWLPERGTLTTSPDHPHLLPPVASPQ